MALPDASTEPLGDARERRSVRWSAALQLIPLAVVFVVITAGLDRGLVISRASFLVSAVAMMVLIWSLRPAFREPAGRPAMIANTVGLVGAVAGIVVSVLGLVGGVSTDLISAVSSAGQGIWLIGLGVFGARLPAAILRLAIAGGVGSLVLGAETLWLGTQLEIAASTTASILAIALFVMFFGLTSAHRWTGGRSSPARATA